MVRCGCIHPLQRQCVDSLIQLVSRTSYSVYVRIYPIYLNTRKGWTHTCGPLGESFCCLSGPLRHKIQVWSSLPFLFLHSTADKTNQSPFLTLYIRLVENLSSDNACMCYVWHKTRKYFWFICSTKWLFCVN